MRSRVGGDAVTVIGAAIIEPPQSGTYGSLSSVRYDRYDPAKPTTK